MKNINCNHRVGIGATLLLLVILVMVSNRSSLLNEGESGDLNLSSNGLVRDGGSVKTEAGSLPMADNLAKTDSKVGEHTPFQGNQEIQFRARPQRPLVRGENGLLTYPDVQISERNYRAGKVFQKSPLSRVTSDVSGELAKTDLTKEVFEAEFNIGVVEEFLRSDAEFLPLPIGDDEHVLVSVKKTFDRGEHTVTMYGNSGDRDTNETFLVVHDGVMYGMVHEVFPYRAYEYAVSGNGKVAIRELDVEQDIYGECESCKNGNLVSIQNPSDNTSLSSITDEGANTGLAQSADHLTQTLQSAGILSEQDGEIETNVVAGVNNDPALNTVDVVVTYLAAAVTDLGGVSAAEARIIGHIDSTTQLFANSLITDTAFNLLGTADETVATGGIVRPTDPADHNTLQTLLGADISGKMYSGGGGSAWTPGGAGVYEGFQFGSFVGVSTGSSFPHEICHNFGSNHSYTDGGFNNDVVVDNSNVNADHYGWRFRVEGYNYRTVMSYTTHAVIGTNAVNSYGPRIGYLSTPNQTYPAAYDGGTVNVDLGVVDGFNGTSYQYMDASLLQGGRATAVIFNVNDQGTPADFTDDTFTYAGGGTGVYVNGYNGTYADLGANNRDLVASRVSMHVNYRSRSSSQFVTQPLASYSSGQDIDFSVFGGGHADGAMAIQLRLNGVLVQTIDATASAHSGQLSWEVPETGLVSGTGYQIYVITADNVTLQSNSFELNISGEILPIAHYRLDETSGTVLADSSGNGYDATLLSGTLASRDNVGGGALVINADDPTASRGFAIPATVKAEINDEITVMFWARGDATMPRTNSVVSGGGLNVHLGWPGGTHGMVFWDAGYPSGPERVSFLADEGEIQGEWNHYAFTKNAATGIMEVYINGILKVSGTAKTTSLSSYTGVINIGSAAGVGASAYSGIIDEVLVFKRALSVEKIEEFMNEPLDRVDLLAYYKFEEGTGTEIKDETPFKHEGVFQGGLWNAAGKVGGGFELDSTSANDGKGFSTPFDVGGLITNEVSFSFWTYGGEELPKATSFINGAGFNCHLPWITGGLFWDAGYNPGPERAYYGVAVNEYKGRWNHYVLTKDAVSGVMQIYVNGELKTTVNNMFTSLSAYTGSINIGSSGGGGSNAFDGLVDEFKIYRKVITPTEVLMDYDEALSNYEKFALSYSGIADGDYTASFSIDHDGDGVVSGLEYVFFTDPTDPSARGLVEPPTFSAGNVVFEFDRSIESTEDTTQIFQYASDLNTWDDVSINGTVDVEFSSTPLGGGMERVKVTIPQSEFTPQTRGFGRLKVNQ